MRQQRLIAGIIAVLITCCGNVVSREIPKYPKIGEWQPQKNVQVYTPDNLFDYINGASELYLSYQFQQLDVIYYKNRKKQEIVVEVYQHQSPLYAFGIYSQECSPESDYLSFGTESYIDGSNLFILAGNNYIKIYSYDLGDSATSQLTQFGQAFISFLKVASPLPKLIAAFPTEYLQPKSEQFVARNFLGYSFFNNGYQTFYQKDGVVFQLFIIETDSSENSHQLLRQYLQHIQHPMQNADVIHYDVNDPYHGEGVIRICGNFIYGGFGLTERDIVNGLLDGIQRNICP